MDLTTRYCPGCREDRLFDQPHQTGHCPDAGDALGECPELACTACGLALVIAFAAPAPAIYGLGAEHHRRAERAA